MKSGRISGQDGIALVASLLLLTVLLAIASIALMMTSTDMKITGYFKSYNKAFYVAEAGVEEAKARMRAGAAYQIIDSLPTQVSWAAYIGSTAKSQAKGYDSSNALHIRTDSMQPEMDYVVTVVHQTDSGGNILYWGDANHDGVNERSSTSGPAMRNIYFVTSEAITAGSKRIIEAEIAAMPPVNMPAALYVNATTTVKGSSTHIIGTDACGGADLAGIGSSRPEGSIVFNGSPTIAGAPGITYNATVMNVANLINTYKSSANFTYAVSNATHTASTTPGPGQGWGTPTAGANSQSPSSCSVHNIVYYNTGGTEIQLSGGVSGCGMLLVEGNLKLTGDFSWYGQIMTTGSMTFLGGGDKNITGAVLSGSSATNAEDDVIGGNTNIVYCSSAIKNQTDSMAMQTLSWKDKTTP